MKLGKKFLKENSFLTYCFSIFEYPIYICLITILLLSLIIQIIFGKINFHVLYSYHYTIIELCTVICLYWFLFRLLEKTKEKTIHGTLPINAFDKSIIYSYYKIGQILLLLTEIFIILSILDVPLLALTGTSTIIFGILSISQQELLKNLVGSITLYFDRPFSIGDYIQIIEKKISGQVLSIGLRITCIKRIDTQLVYIPNSLFLTSPIINRSRRTHRKISQHISIRHEDSENLRKIFSDIEVMIRDHPLIDSNMQNVVGISDRTTRVNQNQEGGFGINSTNFIIQIFTKINKKREFHRLQDEIMLEIKKIIERRNSFLATSHLILQEETSRKASHRH